MEEKIQKQQPLEEESLDLIEILQKPGLNANIFIVTGVAMALGLLVALLTPNQYTASCTLVPQTGENVLGEA